MPALLTVLSPADAGADTLRDIMAIANSNGEADTIQFDAAVTTVTLTSGQISYGENQDLTINGAGVTVNSTAAAAATSRIFNFNAAGGNPTVTINGITLSGGNLSTGNNGGAILINNDPLVLNGVTLTGNKSAAAGGALASTSAVAATLSINNSTITLNSAASTGGAAIFGASTITLSITNSTISSNTATAASGGVQLAGAATVTINSSTFNANKGSTGGAFRGTTTTTFTATNSTFSNNVGTSGGALSFAAIATSSATLDRCTVSGNSGSALGGGLYGSTAGTFTISNSTFSGNTAGTGGGAIRVNTMALNITNSTFSGNTSNGTTSTAGGGAILVASTPNVSISNSTIVNNTVANATAIGGGIFVSSTVAGTLKINSTIIANNTNTTNRDFGASGSRGITGSDNFFGALDTGKYTLAGTGNQFGTEAAPIDPLLGALALNGAPAGSPLTHLPQAGSLAINRGGNPLALTTDQRGVGFPREVGVKADVGSVETGDLGPAAVATAPDVVAVGGTTQTVTVVYTDETGIDVSSIDLNDVTLSGTFTAGGTFGPVSPVSFMTSGTGTSVTATYTFDAPGGAFGLEDNGNYTVSVVANQVFDTDTPTPLAVPAGIYGAYKVAIPQTFIVDATNDETTDTDTKTSLREALAKANADGLADTIVFDPTVFAGATTITMAVGLNQFSISNPVIIVGPAAALTVDAGGLSRHFGIDVAGKSGQGVSISNITLTNGNAAATNGGSILNADEALTLTSVVIQNSSTTAEGGGISVSAAAGSLILVDSIIRDNKATGTASNGGGVDIRAASAVTITRTTVSGNVSGEDGGGIYFFSGGSLTMLDSTVSGNKSNTTATAVGAGGGGMYLFNVVTNITQSTISGNASNTGAFVSPGGGIAALSTSKVTIVNSTIAFNDAGTSTGGGINRGGTSTITLESTIVSDNNATTGPDVNGPVTVNKSLLSNTAGATITGANNKLNVSAKLDPLANNGGTTLTHLPQFGSVVRGAGSNPGGLTLDQRGGPRVLQGAIDIGSVESIDPSPLAAATAPDIVTATASPQTITVTYTDAESNIDTTKLDNNDLEVTGPGGPYAVTFKGSTPAGMSVTATYELAPPGGTFDPADNGTYTVNVKAGEVFDTDTPTPNAVVAGPIGSFLVNIGSSFVVDATNDELVDTDTKTSLREALAKSNADVTTLDTITFDGTVFASVQTITMVLGELAVASNVTITGPAVGVILDGNALNRLFNMSSAPTGAAIVISNMTMTNGARLTTAIADAGGAILISDENVTLNNCTVSNSTTMAEGGGIHIDLAAGTLTLNDCTVTGNKATGPQAFAVGNGGGISVSQGSNDTAVILNRSVVSGNSATGAGGGIYFANNGSLVITDSTISGNTASDNAGGGGIYFFGTVGTLGFKITNSTITGNNASGGPGGGIELYFNLVGGAVEILNTTITANNAKTQGGGVDRFFGSATGTVSLTSTIVAGNTVDGVATAPTADLGSTAASTIAGNNNLIGIQDAATKVTLTGTGNLTGTVGTKLDAKLGPLALNGAAAGKPMTHALLTGSPAIDAGLNPAALSFDQRGTGFNRTMGAGTDIGSFEVQEFTFVVNATNDELTDTDGKTSLREALAKSNANVSTLDTITFDATVFAAVETINMVLGELVIASNVTITGPAAGVIVDGQALNRLFNTSSAPTGALIVISNMTMTNGKRATTAASDAGGAMFIGDEAVTLNNCSLTNNTTPARGGAIGMLVNSKLTLNDCVVTGNKVTGANAYGIGDGGAISINGGAADVTLNRTTMSGNTATGQGGAIYFAYNGSLNVDSSTISGNSAAGTAGGGGIYFYGIVSAAGFNFTNSTISGNKATAGPGGGVELNSITGTVNFRNTTVTLNEAASGAGGVGRTGGAGVFALSSTIVAQNKSGGSATAAKADLAGSAAISVAGDNNLVGVMDAGNLVTLTGTGNQVGSTATPLDAKLGPLALNGVAAGKPMTHELLAGSPAINTGINPAALSFDQRGPGFNRTVGGGTDIGAFEVQSTATAAKVTNVKIDDGTIQRSMIRSLTVTFDQPVELPGTIADAFTLTKQGGGAVNLAGSVDGTGTIVTLTFTGGEVEFTSLKDGRFDFTILANKVTTGGGTLQLDGDGNGTGGDNFVLNSATAPAAPTNVWRLFGDADGDNDVDTTDFGAFRAVFGGTSSTFDFDNDGDVDTTDFGAFRARFGASV